MQYQIDHNGNIEPCPYREQCGAYGIGCKGQRGWCRPAHEGRPCNKKKEKREQDND